MTAFDKAIEKEEVESESETEEGEREKEIEDEEDEVGVSCIKYIQSNLFRHIDLLNSFCYKFPINFRVKQKLNMLLRRNLKKVICPI